MDAQFKEAGLHYMATSARSMLDRLAGGQDELFVSGSDLRQALEVAAAVHLSAEAGGAPVRLPLEDRAVVFYPRACECNRTLPRVRSFASLCLTARCHRQTVGAEEM